MCGLPGPWRAGPEQVRATHSAVGPLVLPPGGGRPGEHQQQQHPGPAAGAPPWVGRRGDGAGCGFCGRLGWGHGQSGLTVALKGQQRAGFWPRARRGGRIVMPRRVRPQRAGPRRTCLDLRMPRRCCLGFLARCARLQAQAARRPPRRGTRRCTVALVCCWPMAVCKARFQALPADAFEAVGVVGAAGVAGVAGAGWRSACARARASSARSSGLRTNTVTPAAAARASSWRPP